MQQTSVPFDLSIFLHLMRRVQNAISFTYFVMYSISSVNRLIIDTVTSILHLLVIIADYCFEEKSHSFHLVCLLSSWKKYLHLTYSHCSIILLQNIGNIRNGRRTKVPMFDLETGARSGFKELEVSEDCGVVCYHTCLYSSWNLLSWVYFLFCSDVLHNYIYLSLF
jgi:hypothetical protein